MTDTEYEDACASDAETEELEEDTCTACGKVVVVDFDDSGYTIANCNTCDAMCCRACLEPPSCTRETPCCVRCEPSQQS